MDIVIALLWAAMWTWLLALAAGPLVFCCGSWKSVIRNDPFRFQVTIPGGMCLPAGRKGYFRWPLPPILVVEFWDGDQKEFFR